MSDYMDTAHYRVNKYAATIRTLHPDGEIIDRHAGIELRLSDLETVIREWAEMRETGSARVERSRDCLSFEGNGRVSVQDVDALVESPQFQRQVEAVRELASSSQGRDPALRNFSASQAADSSAGNSKGSEGFREPGPDAPPKMGVPTEGDMMRRALLRGATVVPHLDTARLDAIEKHTMTVQPFQNVPKWWCNGATADSLREAIDGGISIAETEAKTDYASGVPRSGDST